MPSTSFGDILLIRESNLRQTFFPSLGVNYSGVTKSTIDIPLCFDIQANYREKLVMSIPLIIHHEGGKIHIQPHEVQAARSHYSMTCYTASLFYFVGWVSSTGKTNTNLNNLISPCYLLSVPREYLQYIQSSLLFAMSCYCFQKYETRPVDFIFQSFDLTGSFFLVPSIWSKMYLPRFD